MSILVEVENTVGLENSFLFSFVSPMPFVTFQMRILFMLFPPSFNILITNSNGNPAQSQWKSLRKNIYSWKNPPHFLTLLLSIKKGSLCHANILGQKSITHLIVCHSSAGSELQGESVDSLSKTNVQPFPPQLASMASIPIAIASSAMQPSKLPAFTQTTPTDDEPKSVTSSSTQTVNNVVTPLPTLSLTQEVPDVLIWLVEQMKPIIDRH